MNSATVPEIHLHYTKQVFSLNVSLSSFTPSFSVLTHLWRDKGQKASLWLHFKSGRKKEIKAAFVAGRAALASDIHYTSLSFKLSALMQRISSTSVFLNSGRAPLMKSPSAGSAEARGPFFFIHGE